MSPSVVTPERVKWRVGRRWVSSRVCLRGGDWRDWRDLGPTDLGDLSFFESPSGFLAGMAVIATAMVLFLVIWPIVAIAIELVLVALILVFGIAGRVLFRRPWTVSACSATTESSPREHTWQVVGWRGSARLIEDVVKALEEGTDLPPGKSTVGPPPRPIPQPSDPATRR